MTDIKSSHLGTAAAAGRRDGKTHLVVDIHKRQGTGGVGTGTGYIGVFRTQSRKLITDTAAGFQGQPGLVYFAQDVIHGVSNGSGNRTVNSGSGWLVFLGAGIGNDSASWDYALT